MAAFEATKQAREQLQACLEQEQSLLNELQDPLYLCLQQSVQILQSTTNKLRLDNPQREQRHSEVLIRCGVASWQFVVSFCCTLCQMSVHTFAVSRLPCIAFGCFMADQAQKHCYVCSVGRIDGGQLSDVFTLLFTEL